MLDVIYEDNHIIVVLKPQNILSQSDKTQEINLLSIVKEYIREKYAKPGNVFVGLVHRLDRPTGGVMVFAKTSKAAARLSEQIRDGLFIKNYMAVVTGKPRDKVGNLKHYLKKDTNTNIVTIVPQAEDGAKAAELNYEIIEEKEGLTLVKVHILTGRSHQIRVQMASLKTPIFGDAKYGKNMGGMSNCLALWAAELKFLHPITKKQLIFKSYPSVNEMPWNLFKLDKFFKM